MITEDYVSFEVAKLLKEKGFDTSEIDGYFQFVYYSDGKIDFYDDDKPLFVCKAVTLQMAMKWLREVHKLSVRPRYDEVEDEKEHLYYVWFFDILSMNPYKTLVEPVQGYSTYEEAAEAAIKYCLENLI